MGYYTSHELGTYDSNKDISEILTNLPDGDFEDLRFAVDDYGGCGQSCKWYDHEKDMRRLSVMFPDVTFELCGEGEEQGDSWKEYYRNGKMQRCQATITFPPFDESKLQ